MSKRRRDEFLESTTVQLIGGREDEEAELDFFEDGDDCCIELRYRDKEISACSSDFFEAFCLVRLQLERDRLYPFCFGASLNVFPSAMGRDMGAGLRAYRLTNGRHSSIEDLVDIFDTGPDVIPASVANQRRFYEDWLKSL